MHSRMEDNDGYYGSHRNFSAQDNLFPDKYASRTALMLREPPGSNNAFNSRVPVTTTGDRDYKWTRKGDRYGVPNRLGNELTGNPGDTIGGVEDVAAHFPILPVVYRELQLPRNAFVPLPPSSYFSLRRCRRSCSLSYLLKIRR